MKLSEAVGILNACRHRGCDDWALAGVSGSDAGPLGVTSSRVPNDLIPFEAIAIAEKYKEGETPESIVQEMQDEAAVASLLPDRFNPRAA